MLIVTLSHLDIKSYKLKSLLNETIGFKRGNFKV